MASLKIKKPKKTDEDSQPDDDGKSESRSDRSDNAKRPSKSKRLLQEGSKESSEVFQPQPVISLKKPLPTKAASKPAQEAGPSAQGLDADREYLRFFEKDMYPLLQRIKQDLLVDKPKEIVALNSPARLLHRLDREREARRAPQPSQQAPASRRGRLRGDLSGPPGRHEGPARCQRQDEEVARPYGKQQAGGLGRGRRRTLR